MPVEFLGIAATNYGSETTQRSGAAFDKEYTLRLARAHEDHGWGRVLFAYGCGSPGPAPAAAYIASGLERLEIVSDVFPVRQPRPGASFGDWSPAAYAAGGAEADVYRLWGGSLVKTAEQIEHVKAGERYDRALWTTAAATGGAGNPDALVGTPQTVARGTRTPAAVGA
ncbi:hypothetical protein EV562_10134 [Streptomyces sp. BK208]|nr:hypothetical protein EV562_10134 [Streptomyces sp. BK208]